jgi:hypothetical protein
MQKKQEIILNLINWTALSELLTGNKTSIRKNQVPEKYLEYVQELLSMIRVWYDVNLEGDIVPIEVNLKSLLKALPPDISAFKAKPRGKVSIKMQTHKMNFSKVGFKD